MILCFKVNLHIILESEELILTALYLFFFNLL